MCPIYEYECAAGHRVEKLRSLVTRDDPETCHCGAPSPRVEISQPHVMPDGMYSYMPNVGSEAAFERKRSALRNGERVYAKDSS